MKNQRKIAIDILLQHEKDKSLLKDLLKNFEDELNSQEYGFIKTLIYGTVRYKIRLDYIISKLSKIKIKKLHAPILYILRLSLFQLIYMSHIPESAVINEGVNLAKIYGNKGSIPFVNGILRTFLRNKHEIIPVTGSVSKDHKSIVESFPGEIVSLLGKRYEDIVTAMEKFNTEINLTVRANVLQTNRDKLMESLSSQGFDVKGTNLSSTGISIINPYGIFDTIEFNRGDFYIQSEASQFVSEVSGALSGMEILDLCAAPGGKTSHLYELTHGNGNITACDITKTKINVMKENFSRMNYENINTELNDATKLREDFIDKFDMVLVDAPCSSLGLIRRMPELKYNKGLDDVIALSKKQTQIMNNAYKYLKKGGTLIYSTCTFTTEENEDVIRKFIEEHKDMHVSNIKGEETFYVDPIAYDSDAFCITKLLKEE